MEFTESELQAITKKAGIDPDDTGTVRRTYSGRYMYGAECLGIVGRGPNVYTRFVMALQMHVVENRVDDLKELAEIVDRVRWDDMGTGMIHYWPEIQVVGDGSSWRCTACGDLLLTEDAANDHERGRYLDADELSEWLGEDHTTEPY